MTEQSTTPLSWRDVHTLVKESRDEILASVEKGFAGTTEVLTGHSLRISALEQQNVVEAAARSARELLAAELRTAEVTRSGRTDRFLSGTRGAILLMLAMLSTILTAWKALAG